MTVSTTPCSVHVNIGHTMSITMDLHAVIHQIIHRHLSHTLASVDDCCHQIWYSVYVVCHGLYKPLIGKHDTETTAGQTQQLLIVLSVTDLMW